MIQTEHGEQREPGCNLELVPRPITNLEAGAPRPHRLAEESLLAEIEDIRKTMPPRATISWDTQENHNWFGRVSAAIEKWNPSKSTLVQEHLDLFFSNRHARERAGGLNKLLVLLDQAQADLRLRTCLDAGGPAKSGDSAPAAKIPDLAGGLRRMLLPDAASTEIAREHTIRIFISHSHADAAIAEAFADLFRSAFNLQCDAIRCSSVPRCSLQFGVEVPEQIRDEVLAAAVLIGIVSESSRESAWVLFELGARWGTSKSLIPVLAANGDADLLPPPIRDSHAMKCTFDNVIKLVEEVAPLLNAPTPRTSTYTKHIQAILETQVVTGSPNQPAGADQIVMRLMGETRALKHHLREIRRRWPDSQVLFAPLDRFTWGAEIGQKLIDADVQEGMRFHDRMVEYATALEEEFPRAFDLTSIIQNQQIRKSYNVDRVLDLLDDYVDRFQDMRIQDKRR